MINITYIHPQTLIDVVWSVNIMEHSAFIDNTKIAIADAGDYIDPDVHYKSGYDTTKLMSNPIASSEIGMLNQFRESTKKGWEFRVGASVVPLIGYDYMAIRTGVLTPKSLHLGRFFSFVLNCRVLRAAE